MTYNLKKVIYYKSLIDGVIITKNTKCSNFNGPAKLDYKNNGFCSKLYYMNNIFMKSFHQILWYRKYLKIRNID